MATRHGTATVTLPSDTEILITRDFEAPRSLLWDALTTPRHLLRWWGRDHHPLVACEIDLRPGGAWRYVSRDAAGNELAWSGIYTEVVVHERIVSTEVFEGHPDAEAATTATLSEHDNGTTLQTLIRHRTRVFRDGHVNSGMEAGMQLTFNRLDDLLSIADTPAERFRRVAGRFADRIAEVPPTAWSNPSPCEGWTARDVVGHLVDWVPSVIGRAHIEFPKTPTDSNPAVSWKGVADILQAALDDGEVAQRRFDAGPPGELTVEAAIDMLVTGDVLIHTWDLARATGLDERLDEGLVEAMLAGLEPLDEMLRSSGHYGSKTPVPEGATTQTRLIAFTGRDPTA